MLTIDLSRVRWGRLFALMAGAFLVGGIQAMSAALDPVTVLTVAALREASLAGVTAGLKMMLPAAIAGLTPIYRQPEPEPAPIRQGMHPGKMGGV